MTNLNQATVLSMVSELEVLIANRENGGKVKSLNVYLAPVQRAFINGLLDAPWCREELNERTMLKVIVAQLGACAVNEIPESIVLFAQMTIKQFLSKLLRRVALSYPVCASTKLLAAAGVCESLGSIESLSAAAATIERINSELDFESDESWTDVRYSDLLASQLNYLSAYACVKPLSYARHLATLAVAASEEFGYEILNQYVEELLQILMDCQYPGAEHLHVVESNGENRDILLAHVHKMADQLGETEACEFANVMHGIMLGKPVGVVLMTPTGVQSAPLDPARVYQQSDSIRITPVDYKLKFCIDQAARYVFVSFGDLSCTSGLAASWRIGLDGALEVIDYVLIGAGFSAVAHAAL